MGRSDKICVRKHLLPLMSHIYIDIVLKKKYLMTSIRKTTGRYENQW